MRKLRNNNNKSKKHHTRKEYGLKMDLGDEIDEKFHKFTILFRKNKNKYEESKNINNSFSSDEDNNEYYDHFLQKLTEKNNPENNNNDLKENNSKKKQKVIQKSSILSNKKYRNLLKQSLMKNNPIKNNHLSLTPINEEKIDQENLHFNSLKPHPFIKGKYYSHKINYSNDIHSSFHQSRVNSNKSKENLNDKNSLILNDIKNNQSLILGNLGIRNSKNSFTPIFNNNHYKTHFSSIKSKKSPYKAYDSSSFVLGIKNSKTDVLKKIDLKEEEKQINNSLEEASGINFKPNYNFNPQKIDIQNITLNNNQENKENQNEKIIENELKKNENNQTQSESSMRIKIKKRCLFCCLPIY